MLRTITSGTSVVIKEGIFIAKTEKEGKQISSSPMYVPYHKATTNMFSSVLWGTKNAALTGDTNVQRFFFILSETGIRDK